MKTRSNKTLSKIGIGSYGIGGRGHRDMELTEKREDQVYIDALIYSLNKGMNFTEIALGYGHGNSLSLFKKAIDKSSVEREDLFITHAFYTRDFSSFADVQKDIDAFYQIMETDYADSTLVTQSFIKKFGKDLTYKMLGNLLDSGKTRYVSLSNAGKEMIREFKKEFGEKFFCTRRAHEF